MPSRPNSPTSRPAASTTGNSLWLVRSRVSTASSMCASGASVANCVIIAEPTGTPRDIARSETSRASEAAAKYTKMAMKISIGL